MKARTAIERRVERLEVAIGERVPFRCFVIDPTGFVAGSYASTDEIGETRPDDVIIKLSFIEPEGADDD